MTAAQPVKVDKSAASPAQSAEVDINKPLTFYDIESDKTGPIYVINNTDGVQRGNVTFQVPKRNGVGYDVISVPPTWLPIDLLAYVSRQQLADSSEFRRTLDPMVTKTGQPMLKIIHPDLARKMLNEPGAAEEAAEIKRREAASFDIERPQIEVVHSHEGQKEAQVAAKAKTDAQGPNTRVEQLIAQLIEGAVSEIHVLNSLRGMGTLQQADYKYVLAKADKSHATLIAWARGKIKA